MCLGSGKGKFLCVSGGTSGGAINGMSIVNCLENESPSAGEVLTLSVDCLL